MWWIVSYDQRNAAHEIPTAMLRDEGSNTRVPFGYLLPFTWFLTRNLHYDHCWNFISNSLKGQRTIPTKKKQRKTKEWVATDPYMVFEWNSHRDTARWRLEYPGSFWVSFTFHFIFHSKSTLQEPLKLHIQQFEGSMNNTDQEKTKKNKGVSSYWSFYGFPTDKSIFPI
jgi:hypothetical protein